MLRSLFIPNHKSFPRIVVAMWVCRECSEFARMH